MKKMISMILTAALLLTAFTGCSREAEPQNTRRRKYRKKNSPRCSLMSKGNLRSETTDCPVKNKTKQRMS